MFNYENTIKSLDLQDLNIHVLDIMESDTAIILSVRRKDDYVFCNECQVNTNYHYDTRSETSKIRHSDYCGKFVFLLLNKRRFKCRECGRIISEQLKSLKPYQRTTTDFEKNVLSALTDLPFKKVQSQFSISYSFLRHKLFKHIKHDPLRINWEEHFKEEDIITLGIDEHSSKKSVLSLTITNITKHKLITILPKYSQKCLEQFLRSIPSNYRKRVNFVAMDFTNKYGKIIKKWLINTEIVGDHFHLIGMANKILWNEKRVLEGIDKKNKVKNFKLLLKAKEKLKKDERQKVEKILQGKQREKLKRAYELKEELRSAMRDKNTKRGIQKFLEITRKDIWNRESLNRNEHLKYSKYYRTFIETLQKWKIEIINFIETRITNAYTEGVHTKIKNLKRLSYGLPNIDVYIKRMILAFSS